jgi:hypothetical protein
MYFGSAIQIRRGRRTGQAPSTTLALATDRFDSGPPVRAGQWLWRGRADRNVRGRPRLLVGHYNILTGFPGETCTDYQPQEHLIPLHPPAPTRRLRTHLPGTRPRSADTQNSRKLAPAGVASSSITVADHMATG